MGTCEAKDSLERMQNVNVVLPGFRIPASRHQQIGEILPHAGGVRMCRPNQPEVDVERPAIERLGFGMPTLQEQRAAEVSEFQRHLQIFFSTDSLHEFKRLA